MYGTEPRYSKQISPFPWHFVKSRFHCSLFVHIAVVLFLNGNFNRANRKAQSSEYNRYNNFIDTPLVGLLDQRTQ